MAEDQLPRGLWGITGGCGHVGLALAATLRDSGRAVRLFDIVDAPTAAALRPPYEYVQGDIVDEAAVWRLLSGGDGLLTDRTRAVDVVIHLSGAGMSGGGMLDHALCTRVNVNGTEAVIRGCKRLAAAGQPTLLIYLSTYNVCFHGQRIDHADESTPYSPAELCTDAYSRSKCVAEQAVLATHGAADGLVRTLALRPAAIFGENETRHLPRIVRMMRCGLTSIAVGDSAGLQDWIHIGNLVHALLRAVCALAAHPEAVGGRAYFVNDGEPVNSMDLLSHVARAVNCRETPLAWLPLTPSLALARVCELMYRWFGLPPLLTRAEVCKVGVHHTFSYEAARRDLGYVPRYGSHEAMKRVALTLAQRYCPSRGAKQA